MGCVSSSQYKLLEARVRQLEQAAEQPNSFTEEQLLQAIRQKHGQASQQLIRLEKLIQDMKAAENVISAGEPKLNKVHDSSTMKKLSPGNSFTASKYSLISVLLHVDDELQITRNNKTFTLANPTDSSNKMGSVTHLLSPGDRVYWAGRWAEPSVDISVGYIMEL